MDGMSIYVKASLDVLNYGGPIFLFFCVSVIYMQRILQKHDNDSWFYNTHNLQGFQMFGQIAVMSMSSLLAPFHHTVLLDNHVGS